MFFDVLFFISVFVIFFGEFLYPKIIFFLPQKPVKRSGAMPKITVLIPAYNEEIAIADKIKNTLSLDYPQERREIVVIDNSSSDKTYEIASEFPVILLKSKRGKINALNEGINYAKTDIIVVSDVDILLNKKSLKSAVSCLTENVGAVNGYIIAKSKDPGFLMREKEEYKKRDWDLRYRESMIDSVCNVDGKFVIFRKSIFSGFPENALVEDYFMTFDIRGKGYRLIVDKSAEAYENLIKGSFKDEVEQFKRYATSALIINFRNIKFLFNPKYGYFGLLTFPFRRFFPVLYPVFMLYSGIFLLIIGLSVISKFSVPIIILISGLTVIFLLLIVKFLWFHRRLMFVQLLAVLSSYIDLFKKNDLKFGRWETLRKNK